MLSEEAIKALRALVPTHGEVYLGCEDRFVEILALMSKARELDVLFHLDGGLAAFERAKGLVRRAGELLDVMQFALGTEIFNELALELDQHTVELQNLCIETGMYLEVTGYAHPRDWCRLHGDWCDGCRAAYDREQLALALIFGPDEQDAPCDCGYCNEDSED